MKADDLEIEVRIVHAEDRATRAEADLAKWKKIAYEVGRREDDAIRVLKGAEEYLRQRRYKEASELIEAFLGSHPEGLKEG